MDIRIIKRLRKVKEALDKPLNDISDEMGLSPSYLSGIFWGKATPNFEFFNQLGRLYHISSDWVLFGKGHMVMEGAVISDDVKKLNIEREIVKGVVTSLLADDILFNEALLRNKFKK